MFEASPPPSSHRSSDAQRDPARQHYRDIGISAVAAALEAARTAPRARRISAWKILDMQREAPATA